MQLYARHFVGERRMPTELGLQQFVDTIGERVELAQGLHYVLPAERRGRNVGDSVDAVRHLKERRSHVPRVEVAQQRTSGGISGAFAGGVFARLTNTGN